MTPAPGESIRYEWRPFTQEDITAFEKATRSTHTHGSPPTLGTVFRWGEFELLKKLKIDLRGLLHTEQTYEYFSPLKVGEKYDVETGILSNRERAGLQFMSAETTVRSGGELKLKAVTAFVVKQGAKP